MRSRQLRDWVWMGVSETDWRSSRAVIRAEDAAESLPGLDLHDRRRSGFASVEANTAGNTDDPWFQFVYDARWRQTATYRASHYSGWTIDANPKEQFVYNMAGVAGSGGSSYIDSVILRDRDANTAWEDSADATLEERTYYCQNWRADVVALMTDAGQLFQQVRYDPYGVPFGLSKADVNGDGSVNTTDITRFGTIWNGGSGTHPLADWNFDGSVNTADYTAYLNSYNNDTALGRGDLSYAWSAAGGASRKGYAGYEIDPTLTGSEGWESIYHVRNRVYLSQLGRWTRRDPLGYVDGMSVYAYGAGVPLRHSDPSGLRWIPCDGEGCQSGTGGKVDGGADSGGGGGDDDDDSCRDGGLIEGYGKQSTGCKDPACVQRERDRISPSVPPGQRGAFCYWQLRRDLRACCKGSSQGTPKFNGCVRKAEEAFNDCMGLPGPPGSPVGADCKDNCDAVEFNTRGDCNSCKGNAAKGACREARRAFLYDCHLTCDSTGNNIGDAGPANVFASLFETLVDNCQGWW